MDSIYPPAKRQKPNQPDSQFVFNRKLLLSICRDLSPFSQVENPGFRFLWETYNTKYKLPSRSTLEIACLDDLYLCSKNKMINLLKNTCDHASITFDCWSDNAKQRAFIGYTYHFLDKNWQIKTAVLKVASFQRPHTAERIRDNFIATLNEFEISEKKISIVTDGGSNMIKSARLLNVKRAGCISHAVHLLVTKDLLKHDEMGEIRDLLTKLRAIQCKMVYKYEEMKSLDREDKTLKLFDALQRFSDMGIFYLN